MTTTNANVSDISDPSSADEAKCCGLSRKDWLCLAILWITTAALWVPRLNGPIDLRWDAGVYYILGTSIAHGDGYRLLNEPGNPQAIQYPPLLPAFVALNQWVLRTDDPIVVGVWLQREYMLLSFVYVAALYALVRLFLKPGFALLASMLGALHMSTYYFAYTLYTEIPFALL